MEELGPGCPTEEQLPDYVADIAAEFDPQSCVTCNLFAYCRDARAGLDELLSTAPPRPGTLFGEPGTRALPRQIHQRTLAAFTRGTLSLDYPNGL
jgi:hypothetical protein